MDECIAKVQNDASIPLEKDEAFPPVFRLSDEAFPFDSECVAEPLLQKNLNIGSDI